MAAALSAVNAYLQEEQVLLEQEQKTIPLLQEVQSQNSFWAASGRQDMMSMRQLIQLKAFSRF